MRFTSLSVVQDRAVHELRQGRSLILVEDSLPSVVCTPIDTSNNLELRQNGYVLLSGPRAQTLGLASDLIALPIDQKKGPEQLRFLMQSNIEIKALTIPAPHFSEDLLALAKQGRLIPAFYICEAQGNSHHELLKIHVRDLRLPQKGIKLKRLSTVPLPLDVDGDHIKTTATLFSTDLLGEEPLILAVGAPRQSEAPLVRVHSACLTGDVFGSLRCDCGPQLHAALKSIKKAGHGCLIYLPQEGRDTGLHNKLRAYALQDAGLDTIDADAALGFEPDERDFSIAAALLRDMGLLKIKLLTNNPKKVEVLEAGGIDVVARESLQTPSQQYNQAYLKTKAERAAHHIRC